MRFDSEAHKVRPKVSVVIAVYNRAHLIGETIENLLRQSLPPHELIVVDDGSTDTTAQVVEKYGKKVRLIRQANAGPGAARNAGLACATGTYVQFFDSDDLCTLDKLELQAEALDKSGADFAYSGWIPVWMEDGFIRCDGIVRQQKALQNHPVEAMLGNWLVLLQATMIRRELINRVGGYPTHVSTGEDVELLFRLMLTGARMIHVPGPVLLLRQHPSGQISAAPEFAKMRARDRVVLMRQVSKMLDEFDYHPRFLKNFAWNAETWCAQQQYAALQPGYGGSRRNLAYQAFQQFRQVIGGLRQRMLGWRLGRDYGPGRLAHSQLAAVGELGYSAIIDPNC